MAGLAGWAIGFDYYHSMHHPFRFHGLALAVLLTCCNAVAWGQAADPASAAEPAAEVVQEASPDEQAQLDAELFYEILVGEMAAGGGDLTDAQALMMEAARTSNSEKLYKRATQLALQSRSAERALANARTWLAAKPESEQANRYVLQILVALNRIEDSEPYLQKLVETAPASAKPAIFLTITQLYNRASDKPLAADVVEQALQSDLKNAETGPLAWATIGHMRLLAGNKAGALESLNQAQDLKPDTGAAALLALELLESGSTEVEPMVQKYLAGNPAPQLRLAYARVLIAQQKPEAALRLLEQLSQAAPEEIEPWALQAQLQLQLGRTAEAGQSLDRLAALIAEAPESVGRSAAQSQLYLLQSQLAEKQGQYQKADELLQRIDDAPNLLAVQARRAGLMLKQGRLDEARALIQAVPASTAGQQKLKRMAEIQLLKDAKEFKQAYALQAVLLSEDPQDNELAYDTAILAERVGQHDEMEKLLRGIIERQPDFQHAYNALGYSYADRGIRLDEAEQLIRKALELSPGDPFITDSLAWVKFRQGDSAEALRLLQQAYATRQDVEIAAHLGEVLWARGDRRQAREIWLQGVKLNPDNEVLQETLKRLQVRL